MRTAVLLRSLGVRVIAATVVGSSLASCGSEDGERGPRGPAGAQGSQGEAGPPGSPGVLDGGVEGELNASCMSPCHGFTGLVEQWKSSTHFAAYIANLGGEEVESWTGATACGNCHAIDGIQQRLASNVNPSRADAGPPDPIQVAAGQLNYLNPANSRVAEATYAGQATVAVVHCTTCHNVTAANDPHVTGQNYAPGSFPLRVPSGAADQAWLEASSGFGAVDGVAAGKYGVGNVCMWCHKSRKDVTNYIPRGTTVNITNVYWGPHEGPQADIYTGKGGYHYAGATKAYGNSSHQNFTNGCVRCHMPDVASNQNVGNHSFYAQLSSCQTSGCHESTTSFDVIGGQSLTISRLQDLRVALNNADLLTRSAAAPYERLTTEQLAAQDFARDEAKPKNAVPADQAGALYNYLLIARGSAGGIHNPLYVRQLIWDSLEATTSAPPPYPRPGN